MTSKEDSGLSFPPLIELFVFLTAAVIYAVGAATRAGVPGMVFDTIRRDLGFSAAQTSMISSMGVAGCMFFISFSGMLIDKFGWRKTIISGVILQVFGEYLLYSFSLPWLIYSGSFINGGGRTIGYLTILKYLDVEFDHKYFSILIGIFYIFSYGGTLAGTALFGNPDLNCSWQNLLRSLNILTSVCGITIAGLFLMKRTSSLKTRLPADAEKKISWKPFLNQLRRPQCFCAVCCAAAGIMIYWSLFSCAAVKYLNDVCGVSCEVLSVMNIIVMAEMIFGGSFSYLWGNRRKVFQVTGSLMILLSCILFAAGTLQDQPLSGICGRGAFILLGIGYGCTCVNLSAVRDFVPVEYSASCIGFVNFCANVFIIVMSQTAGFLFDSFPGNNLNVEMRGYQLLFGMYILIALVSFVCAVVLKDSKGRNISAEI